MEVLYEDKARKAFKEIKKKKEFPMWKNGEIYPPPYMKGIFSSGLKIMVFDNTHKKMEFKEVHVKRVAYSWLGIKDGDKVSLIADEKTLKTIED